MLFLRISSRESVAVPFSTTTTNIDSEMLFYLMQVYYFEVNFLRLLIARTGREGKIHSKVANCFYLNALKLDNPKNRPREKFKIIINLLLKRELQQAHEKITKTNKS